MNSFKVIEMCKVSNQLINIILVNRIFYHPEALSREILSYNKHLCFI